MATRHLLADLADAAVAAGLARLEIESVGGVDAARRVREGEPFDLVFLASDALEALATEGHVDASTLTPLVISNVAVAVHDASPLLAAGEFAFLDAQGVREAMLAANRIGYSTGPSGTALLKYIADWGLTPAVADRLVQASAGIPVARLVADGEVDLGFQQYSEILGQPGIRLLGPLPPDCAISTVFAGAVAATAGYPAAAEGYVEYFASESFAPIKRAAGFDIPA